VSSRHDAFPGGPVLAALALLGSLLAACGRGEAKGPPARPPTPVRVATAEVRDVPRTLPAVGTVLPDATVAIRPLVTGPIVEVFFQEGTEVRAGQRLFQIDPRPYEAALAQARAALTRARRLSANAQADARRYGPLRKGGFVSAQQYEAAVANARSLASEVEAQEAAAQRAALDLSRSLVTSPIDGRTGAILVQRGNVVQANQDDPLVVVTRLRPALVSFRVPERHVRDLRQGLGRMRVDAEAAGETRQGTLTFLDSAVDPSAGTIEARARFANEDQALWPGQFVNVRIQLAVERGAVVVPSAAVIAGQDGRAVFVVGEGDTVERRTVEVGPADARQTVITRGVRAGEVVVIDGQTNLAPGARVAVAPARPRGARQPEQARRPAGPGRAAARQAREP
jgi:multidrug efflux system membrane fusion protein